MKAYLNVPYAENHLAKSLGARFDMSRRAWFCPDGVDLMLFRRWLPDVDFSAYDRVTLRRKRRGRL